MQTYVKMYDILYIALLRNTAVMPIPYQSYIEEYEPLIKERFDEVAETLRAEYVVELRKYQHHTLPKIREWVKQWRMGEFSQLHGFKVHTLEKIIKLIDALGDAYAQCDVWFQSARKEVHRKLQDDFVTIKRDPSLYELISDFIAKEEEYFYTYGIQMEDSPRGYVLGEVRRGSVSLQNLKNIRAIETRIEVNIRGYKRRCLEAIQKVAEYAKEQESSSTNVTSSSPDTLLSEDVPPELRGYRSRLYKMLDDIRNL